MFQLQRLNVVKIVDTEEAKNKLISEGFKLIDKTTPPKVEGNNTEYNKPLELDGMSYDELKTVAKGKIKGYNRMKREDLIKSLQEIGD